MNSSVLLKKYFQHAALVSAVTLAAFGASNSFAASTGTGSSADVIAPIEISKGADLLFGRFAANTGANAGAGTVIIDTSGSRSSSGEVTLSAAGSTQSAGSFTVSGDTNASFSVSVPNIDLEEEGDGTNTMALETITEVGASATGLKTGKAVTGSLIGGEQTIHLGGILSVASGQDAGDYSGSVVATVEYN